MQRLLCRESALPTGNKLEQSQEIFVNHVLQARNYGNERRPQIRRNLFFPLRAYNVSKQTKFILQKINKYMISANNGYHILRLWSMPCVISGDSHKNLLERNSYYFHFKMGVTDSERISLACIASNRQYMTKRDFTKGLTPGLDLDPLFLSVN